MPHTPGPWTHSLSKNGWSIFIKSGETLVADFSSGKGDGPEYPSVDEAQSNALLLAAAPELLDALKAAVEVMEEDLDSILDSNCVHGEDGPDRATLNEDAKPYVEALEAELSDARKVIDKAEGRA